MTTMSIAAPALSPRFLALVLAVATAATTCSVARARSVETPVALGIDGRPMSRSSTVAVERDGLIYVDLVAIVRTFDGLLSIRSAETVVTIGAHVARFRPSDARATVDGTSRTMPHAAFRERGDLYVPLGFFVRNVTPGVTLHTNAVTGAVDLHVPAPPDSAVPASSARKHR